MEQLKAEVRMIAKEIIELRIQNAAFASTTAALNLEVKELKGENKELAKAVSELTTALASGKGAVLGASFFMSAVGAIAISVINWILGKL